LVGKELHVSVEDAFLVVEVCQKPEEQENMTTDAEKSTAESGAKTSEEQKGKDAAASASDKKKPAAASKKAAKDNMTVGERVLEKSVIARALSAVPHLFLRDVSVRLVVRDGQHEHVTSEGAPKEEISEMDSVIDFGVELLSVTSGEDFLAHIRTESMSSDYTKARFTEEQKHRSMSSFASFDETSDNEFIVKRIRTGRGPEGGIWLKVFPPGRRIRKNETSSLDAHDNVDNVTWTSRWARERWTSASQFCLFRCSGLDVVSRIYVGKQEPESNDYFFYDEFIVDSMLVGVDYVAPGPAPPLPPLEQNGDAATLEAIQAMREANEYVTDRNGIQSVRLKSVFHKVARGLQPTICKSGHLPCETCSECWTGDGSSAQTLEHPLDASTPLPGVVFNLSLNDPLEVNVDRAALEVIGQLQSLFTKKSTVSESETLAEEPEAVVELSSSIHGGGMCMPSQRQKSSAAENVTDSFPSYMQPENIEITGLHLAKIVFRIHAMRADGVYDRGLSFCYWEAQTRCITLDMQTLSSQKQLQDVRVDIGEFTTVEFKGTGNNQLISLGLPHPEVSSSDSSTSSQPPKKSSSRPPWPSTAYSLLGISVPMETIHYESRERHALQMRYTALSGSNIDEDRSVVDVRVGVTSVDMPFKTKDDIYAVISESQKSVFGPPEDEKPKTDDAPTNEQKTKTKQEVSSKSSLLKCKVRVDGGRVNISPVINLCLPPSTFFVEQSSLYGLFFETLLQRMEFAYGEERRASVAKSRRGNLSRLAALPEGIRLRVLLFVNDLGPLETALGLKHESNSFLRYRGVNKAIVRVAKRSSKLKRKKRESHISTFRREEMLAELLSMDDTALQDLWSLHQGSKEVLKSKLSRYQSA
jgi:predicted DNA binding CopG/RHH family protein